MPPLGFDMPVNETILKELPLPLKLEALIIKLSSIVLDKGELVN